MCYAFEYSLFVPLLNLFTLNDYMFSKVFRNSIYCFVCYSNASSRDSEKKNDLKNKILIIYLLSSPRPFHWVCVFGKFFTTNINSNVFANRKKLQQKYFCSIAIFEVIFFLLLQKMTSIIFVLRQLYVSACIKFTVKCEKSNSDFNVFSFSIFFFCCSIWRWFTANIVWL